MERITMKHVNHALFYLNSEAGYDPAKAGVFDPATRRMGAGFALDSQNLRAAGDRHNLYQLHHYDGKGTGCGDVSCSYSFTLREVYEKIRTAECAMRFAKHNR